MIRCSKCGFEDSDGVILPACNHIDERVDSVTKESDTLKSINDVMEKCHSVLCLNNTEYIAGLESTDVLVEDKPTYHLIREIDKQGLLLIVIHDGETNQISDEVSLYNKVFNKKEESNIIVLNREDNHNRR